LEYVGADNVIATFALALARARTIDSSPPT
jgi:hypothetical protein